MVPDPCDGCSEPVEDALARTVRLSVDRSQVDVQRQCPACFAEWIERYQAEMRPDESMTPDEDDIIVD